ncbi:aldo/keto reductase [Viridibacillus sp. FSL R5-0477]|uniref:Plant-metabolite dehydrogenase n=1 Tax=Viridibacillus arenosi FSL R5-213 TaxID=1227360 RepID=W4EPE9_9BACL|nr:MULTISPECIES: aldo/keto reductase [Viridibacillus]ETT82109.1 plant-metabolite dehydrogenase [Viridibacillus arenosi FSL R5-213]OMC81509.1 glyoxal reductase [Viridibacillus sp. FSL H8-0123]OMC86995.1 glyoxal reductase [Viridibacillus sp. FSL H7-0596]OMC90557.1 glyoxal reductase [Viridibacillus arenosi]
MNITSTKTLHNGVEMPRFGLGVYKMTDREEAIQAMTTAIDTGYIAIDTASLYNNEVEVGEAVKASNVKREDLFITSKVWNADQGYDETLRAFETSLKKLDMDYLDLYLTHWAVPDKFKDTYRAIERLYDEKLLRATGVSNHQIHHLEEIFATANVKPMVNQIEVHPYLTQVEVRNFCTSNDIAVTAWSPLARGKIIDDTTITSIGQKYGKSSAQVVIRWHLQLGNIVIPKSVTPSRIKANAQVFDFELTNEDMQLISALNKDERTGADPDNFSFKF